MRAGKLDQSITIETFGTTTDALGEEIKGWTDFATVRARFIPERMTESLEAGRPVGQRRGTFEIRWLDSLTEKMRIVFDDGSGSKNWNIVALAPIQRKRGWRIGAEVDT